MPETIDTKTNTGDTEPRPSEVALDALVGNSDDEDICGLCGEPGADKYAHPCHWPGEQIPDGPLVHAECEAEECRRAHAALSDEERRAFLGTIR